MLRVAEFFADSDTGRARRANEDAFFARAPVFAVADGMGGAQAGEVASAMAVESFHRGLPDGDSPAKGLVAIIEDANRRIHERSRSDEQRAGKTSTSTSTRGSGPSARVITERCGCASACSSVSLPRATSSPTSEWSRVRRVSSPSRHR